MSSSSGSESTQEICDRCKARSPLLDWNNVCCRARYICNLPSRSQRNSVLASMRDKEQIKKMVETMWNERKK